MVHYVFYVQRGFHSAALFFCSPVSNTELKQKAQPFLDAIEIASEKVWAFINSILARGKETQEHKAPARKRGQDMEI